MAHQAAQCTSIPLCTWGHLPNVLAASLWASLPGRYVQSGLLYAQLDRRALQAHVECVEDTQASLLNACLSQIGTVWKAKLRGGH